LALPDSDAERIRLYTFSETDLALIRHRRGDANRIGFAVQLCLLRYPGTVLTLERAVDEALIRWVARTLWLDAEAWPHYAARDKTRREHQWELLAYLELEAFDLSQFRALVAELTDLALQSDKGLLLATHALVSLRRQRVVVPPIRVLDRVCSQAILRANRRLHRRLTHPLTPAHRDRLEALLTVRPGTSVTWLNWLRQSPTRTSSPAMLMHIERLRHFQSLELPPDIGRDVHRSRLRKIAREGEQMRPQDLGKFEPARRYATLVALAIEGRARVTDEIIDLHDRIMIRLVATAKNKHVERFQSEGQAINDKVRLYAAVGQALVNARECGEDAFAAIEQVIGWEDFVASVGLAEELARPGSFDHLPLVTDQYPTLRRYTRQFLAVLRFEAAPAARAVLAAIDTIRQLNDEGRRAVPPDTPTAFVRARWKPLVFVDGGIDRRGYEICALWELKNALRAGDIWVEGSRQFGNFEDYLIPKTAFASLARANGLPLAVDPDAERYLEGRLATLHDTLTVVNTRAGNDDLPDASLDEARLAMCATESRVPEAAQRLIDRIARLLPRVKITEMLLEVDGWTDFTRHFVHTKTGEPAKNRTRLLSIVLANGINLGLTRMAESSPGASYDQLLWLAAWHVGDETYDAALAELVNAQLATPFARHWGDGTSSSSDGQRFPTAHRAEGTGQVNPRYGSAPGRLIYTHVSDQYTPFSTQLVNVGIRESTFVLDGLLYHDSELEIAEHSTDTAGFTDHVFALMHLLGFRFAPRLRNFGDTRLYVPEDTSRYPALRAMIGGTINVRQIRTHWDEILRLATSIRQGSVTASLMVRKLASYPRQNGLAVALRELGRIERSLFVLDWLQNVDLRHRVQSELNKGETRNALARAVFFNRLGEIRDRRFEQQRHRASGLNLVTAAIVLWNTVYLSRAIEHLRGQGEVIDEALLSSLSPLGRNHINLTGDYVWSSEPLKAGEYRALREPADR